MCLFFFFFKQKTAYEIYQGDWSSDVCSSDLLAAGAATAAPEDVSRFLDKAVNAAESDAARQADTAGDFFCINSSPG